MSSLMRRPLLRKLTRWLQEQLPWKLRWPETLQLPGKHHTSPAPVMDLAVAYCNRCCHAWAQA